MRPHVKTCGSGGRNNGYYKKKVVLSIDGSSSEGKGRAWIVLKSSIWEEVKLSYKLDFQCSNNEAEYEAFILGMLATQELGIQRVKVRGDSNLIVQ